MLGDWAAFLCSLLAAGLWIKLIDAGVAIGVVPTQYSRKVVHISTGPVYLLTWPWFPLGSAVSRFLAAGVPLLVTLQFGLVGLGVLRDDKLVKSSTRGGQPSELLRGPLAYGFCFIAMALIGFRTSPASIIALMTLCLGDGMAEVVGRAIGSSNKLPSPPFCREKSWAGMLAMIVASVAGSMVYLAYFNRLGFIGVQIWTIGAAARLVAVCAAAAIVEAMTYSDWDNAFVCATAWIVAEIVF